MILKGKITQILEPEIGEKYQKQVFVIDTGEKYDNIIALEIFGEERVRKFDGFKEGTVVSCDINIKCREYQGRWYTNLQAWKVSTMEQAQDRSLINEPDDLPWD